jgi:hypothetical protein
VTTTPETTTTTATVTVKIHGATDAAIRTANKIRNNVEFGIRDLTGCGPVAVSVTFDPEMDVLRITWRQGGAETGIRVFTERVTSGDCGLGATDIDMDPASWSDSYTRFDGAVTTLAVGADWIVADMARWSDTMVSLIAGCEAEWSALSMAQGIEKCHGSVALFPEGRKGARQEAVTAIMELVALGVVTLDVVDGWEVATLTPGASCVVRVAMHAKHSRCIHANTRWADER